MRYVRCAIGEKAFAGGCGMKAKKEPPKVLDHQLRSTPIADLKPHPENKRRHANSVIDESIEVSGIYKPVVASTATGHILAGHGTVERAKLAGATDIPVYWLDGLSESEERKILLSDNRSAALGSDDPFSLMGILEDLDGDFLGTGFTGADLDALRADPSLAGFETVGEDGEDANHHNGGNGSSGGRKSGKKPSTGMTGEKLIKAVLIAKEIAIFERALKLTRQKNRGEALTTICRAYLDEPDNGDSEE
jgi:hypothetical protein